MSSSDDDLSSDIDFASVKSMNQYETSVISSAEKKTAVQEKKESKEEIENNIKKIKVKLSAAKLEGKDKLIEKYEKKLEEEKSKLELVKMMPSEMGVDLSLANKTNEDEDNAIPEQNDELLKYWHYRVLHTAFAGENSINLTLDDSDMNIFKSRNAFIRDHCDQYTELTNIDQNLAIPTAIWKSLFPHQRVAVEWLWDKWNDKHGGIEGDEMGLGKTAITCTFFHSLVLSNILKKPILILCPLTVAQQWIRELHIWCPQLRSILLHSTRTNKNLTDEKILSSSEGTINVIVTNYETLLRMRQTMPIHSIEWGIVVCDEGHKIRNYQSTISKLVKKIPADFRLAISGSPIQNSLIELWSLFDFAVPGLLGSLDVFENEFAEPIKIGGYANASPFQVFRAYSSAVALRDLIKPYLLRRMKKDVNANLPDKLEQIFFINLTKVQILAYLDYTRSSACRSIINGNREMFSGIEYLRELCDHPNIADSAAYKDDLESSAKLNLMKKLLPAWKKKDHRVLIFSQYLEMLSFICRLCDELNLDYFRIDGQTPNEKRIMLMDRFNSGEKFACIASTKVGGVGVNLTGADRVIIVDPDWNPSTDNQALERAWRIGQKKNVAVYRLITVGTIEEKMYKKQIFKQFLSNKILQNPNQKRMFAPDTVKDLFRLDMEVESEFMESGEMQTPTKPQSPNKIKLKSSDVEEEESADNDKNFDDDENFLNRGVHRIEKISHDNTTATEDDDNNEDNNDYNDDDSDDQNNDKEVLKGLFDDGDLAHVFHHDNLFNKDKDTPEIYLHRKKAEMKVQEAKEKLKKSSEASVKQKEQDDPQITAKIFKEVMSLFKSHSGMLSSQQILDHFIKRKDLNRKKPLKHVLRTVSVLNKRTHVWHLMSKYKKSS